MFGIGPSDFGNIPRVFASSLQRAIGLTEAEIRTIMIENPQRFLAGF
jgi:predicted metal-dependent phosphotriesterase family hydrolase